MANSNLVIEWMVCKSFSRKARLYRVYSHKYYFFLAFTVAKFCIKIIFIPEKRWFMKYTIRLLLALSLIIPMSVWAQAKFTEKVYINLYFDGTGKTLYLAQEKGASAACTAGESGMYIVGVDHNVACVASELIVMKDPSTTSRTASKIIADFLGEYWNDNAGTYHSEKLVLATDIDFDQTLKKDLAVWSCSENHNALNFSGKEFDGNNKKISNVCGVVDAGQWKTGMGLFYAISKGGSVKNLKLDEVNFIVLNKATGVAATVSDDEKDYGPVGGLAAYIVNSTVDNISLGYINVSAPLAGGLAGYIENTPVTNISMIDGESKIEASNDIVLKTSGANSKMRNFKTVLGGLAGVSYSSSFNDINIYPEIIKNEAESDSSALGGVAGLLVYANPALSEKNVKMENITVESSEKKKVTIQGGTTMGGLFGKTERISTTPSATEHPSDLLINNVVVNKLVLQNSVHKQDYAVNFAVYMGSLIGNSNLCNGGVLKITKSRANDFTIGETVSQEGTYHYHVGGIAGYAGCESSDNASNRNDQYLTITNTHALGSIDMKGGYVSGTDSYDIEASVGGLVGTAMLASDNSVVEDTSSVNIVYKLNGTRPSSVIEPSSVNIGGIFGAASIYNTSGVPLEIKKVIAKGYSSGSSKINIDVEDNGFDSYVGGIIGKFPHANFGGNSSILFDDVSVSNEGGAVIRYGGEGALWHTPTDAYMGGVCGKCQAVRSLYKVSVAGGIVKSSVSSAVLENKKFYVGGLVGKTELSSWPIYVQNTYSVGQFDNFGGKTAEDGEKTGYLFGSLVATMTNEFVSNYHIGNDNAPAIGDFSGVKDVVDFTKVPSNLLKTARANVRNGDDEDLHNVPQQNISDCGTKKIAEMRKSGFVTLLNNAWSDELAADRVWKLGSTAGSSNPVFAEVPDPTKNALVTFVANDEVLSKKYVEIGKAATAPTPPKISDKCFDKWDKAFDKVTEDLTVYAKYNDDACVFTLTFVGPNGFEETRTFIEGGVSAPKPPEKNEKGECFVGWDPENYKKLTEDYTVTAQYGACPVKTFSVTFNGLDGKPLKNVQDKDGNHLDNPQIVEEGKSAVVPKDPNPVNGLCFAGWSKNTDDYTNVTREMTVSAYSKACEYTVTFTYLEKDGTPGKKSQTVEYNKSATPPGKDDAPEKTDDGQCFDGWDADYSKITDDLTVPAKYKTCTYTVRFMYTDNKGVPHIEKTETVEHGESATAPDVPKKMDDLCFISWNPSFSNVTGKLDVTAKYDICKYTVKFVYVDADGVNAEKVETVVHGNDVTGPDDVAKKKGDLCFAGWKGELTNVTSDMTLEPEYKLCAVSSSSVAQSSSSVVASSSSEATPASSNAESSSSVKANSSSATVQSSSSKAGSSSSQKSLYEIAAPKVKQDGSALRMVLDDSTAKISDKVDCHIQVVSDAGVYLDTVVAGKVIDKAKNGTWRLDPAPAGEYSVNFTFTDGEESVTYKKIFSTPKQKNLVMHSWQTLSMYAFCQNGTDNCVSDKASVYWWDETNPVGDYWQYRKYSVKDKFDSTRGYWYGPVDNEPLVMNLKTPDSNAEIVWKLQNKYSGWNLVANPYGWYVKLPQQDGVRFAKWDSDASEYVPTDTLGPYEAVWVQTDKSRTLRIPLKAVIVLEDEKKSLSKSAASDDWNLRVVLSDNNGKRDSWNELAVGSAKSLSEPPAGMGDRVNLSIVEGKKRFAKSVKQNSDNLEWNLEASATTSRAGHLSFVGLERVLAKGLHVYATVDDEVFEVTNDMPLDVQLSPKSKKVSIRVTKGAVTANIAKNWLSGFRVNQTSNVLNVGFDAASELAGANVKVSIVGIDGRVVATNRGVANAGSNVVSMKKPKLGVYFVRVRVGSQSASKRIMVQ